MRRRKRPSAHLDGGEAKQRAREYAINAGKLLPEVRNAFLIIEATAIDVQMAHDAFPSAHLVGISDSNQLAGYEHQTDYHTYYMMSVNGFAGHYRYCRENPTVIERFKNRETVTEDEFRRIGFMKRYELAGKKEITFKPKLIRDILPDIFPSFDHAYLDFCGTEERCTLDVVDFVAECCSEDYVIAVTLSQVTPDMTREVYERIAAEVCKGANKPCVIVTDPYAYRTTSDMAVGILGSRNFR